MAFYSGYRQRGLAPAWHRGLASPFLTLIFTIDEPLHIARHVDPGQAPDSYDALLGGLHVAAAHIRHDGAQSGVQVHLWPLAARRLLGLPAGELTNKDLGAELVLGAAVEQVRDGLRVARSWPERFSVVDTMLRRQLQDTPPVASEVGWVWSRLVRSAGTVPVHTLAREVGWSERHLANRVRQEIGLTPKVAARVIRFDRARRMLQATGGADPAGVAVACGYADQSHMSRDFVQMTGCPPGRWLAAEFGKLQDADPPAGPSLGA